MKLTGSHINGQVQIIAIGSQILYRSRSIRILRRKRRGRLLLAVGLAGAAYLLFKRGKSSEDK